MNILSILGAIFLVILAFYFFPAIIGIIVAVGAVILVGLILAGIFAFLLPLIVILLAVGGLIWLIMRLVA